MTNIHEENVEIEDHEKFLTTFFKDKPDHLWINIWTSKNKTSSWHQDTKTTINKVARKKNEDVYFGIGLTEEGYGSKERGSREKVVGIMGLHLDIDIKDPVHKKQDLPETVDEAMSIITEMKLTPAIVVNSGNGLHVYFLFQKPWIFDSESERKEAESLLRRCHNTAKAIASKKGWTIDSVFDLARVMRVPGTTNNKKPENPVMAKIIEMNDVRYAPDELEDYFIMDPEPAKKQNSMPEVINSEGLIVDMMAEPPAEKFDIFFENEPKFKDLWQKKKDKFSPSEYDWAIVRYCAEAGWSDQDIINTCIAWRRRQNERPEKIKRKDYLNRLIVHAIKCREDAAMNKLNEYQAVKDTPYCSQIDAESLLEDVSKKLKIQIISIDRYNEDPPTFMLHTNRAEVPLDSIKCILQQQKFSEKVAQYTGHIIPDIRSERNKPGSGWKAIAQILLSACKDVELSPDQTRLGAIKADIREYLAANHQAENLQDAIETSRPVFYEGQLLIRLEHFGLWVRSSRRPDENDRTLARQLVWIGGSYKSFNINVDGKRTTRGFWVLPVDMEQGGGRELGEL